jgi:hypothetical protein
VLDAASKDGGSVEVTTETDDNGIYIFEKLSASEAGLSGPVYSLTQVQPLHYLDDLAYVGTSGGTLGVNVITGIVLKAGASTGYDFREYPIGAGITTIPAPIVAVLAVVPSLVTVPGDGPTKTVPAPVNLAEVVAVPSTTIVGVPAETSTLVTTSTALNVTGTVAGAEQSITLLKPTTSEANKDTTSAENLALTGQSPLRLLMISIVMIGLGLVFAKRASQTGLQLEVPETDVSRN